MRNAKFIQIGMIVAGLAGGFSQHVKGATEQRDDRDEGGRRVIVKPISQNRVGCDGGNESLLSCALGGTVLLGLGRQTELTEINPRSLAFATP